MTLVNAASRSRVRISLVSETTRGETPASTTYLVIPHLDSSQLNQTQQFQRSTQVVSNRQGGQQVGGNVMVGGNIDVSMKNDPAVRKLLQSAMSNTFANPTVNGSGGFTLAYAGTGAKASGTITITNQPTANDTITVNGFVVTFKGTVTDATTQVLIGANTTATALALKVFLAAATSALITVPTSTGVGTRTANVAYTSSTNVVTIKFGVLGTAGNSFSLATSNSTDITLSGANLSGGSAGASTITRATGSFLTTEGFHLNDQITTTSSTTATNDIGIGLDVFIVAITATSLTLSQNFDSANEAFASGTTLTSNSYFMKSSTTRSYFTVEQAFTDVLTYEYLRGMEVNDATITIPTSGEVTASFAMVGLIGKISETQFDRSNNLSGTLTAGSGSNTASDPALTPFAGSVSGSQLLRDGTAESAVESMTINLRNNRNQKFSVGQTSAVLVEEGDFDVEFTFSLYFTDSTIQAQYLAGTRLALEVTVVDQTAGHVMIMQFPTVVFTAAPKQLSGSTVAQNMTAYAEQDDDWSAKMLCWIQPAT